MHALVKIILTILSIILLYIININVITILITVSIKLIVLSMSIYTILITICYNYAPYQAKSNENTEVQEEPAC